MAKVFVIAEHRDGKIKKSTLEIISYAAGTGNEVHAVLMAESAGNLVQELGTFGATKVHTFENAAFKYYLAEAYTKALAQFLKSAGADVILTAHTPTGRDFMPRVAARLGVGLASDCTALTFEGSNIKARRAVYSGKATVEVEFVGAGPRMATVRPNALGAPKGDASKKAETATFTADLGTLKTKVVEVVQGTLTRPDVSEAATVISGGRAMKNAENFKILEEAADVIGAGVGASRAAVDAGYRPHRDQVGQTGKVVSPQLYIACGISGAIQHLAGMRSSKVIVAVNTDKEAPIFQVADYGIVADLFSFVPALTKEFKRLKESS